MLKPVKPNTFRLVNTKHRSKGRADDLTFVRGVDEHGRLMFAQVTTDADLRNADALPTHQQDTLLRVWMLTNPTDPRYESDAVAQERALSGVTGKTDLKRNGLEQLVKDGYLHKVPYTNKDGSESTRSPGIAVAQAGRDWIAEQGDWADVRLEEIALRVGGK